VKRLGDIVSALLVVFVLYLFAILFLGGMPK
jgi:hypothetical protein